MCCAAAAAVHTVLYHLGVRGQHCRGTGSLLTGTAGQPLSVAGSGAGGFEAIGTDGEHELKLADLQSYDEMQLSALLSVSVPTLFMNAADRNNHGDPGVRRNAFFGAFFGLTSFTMRDRCFPCTRTLALGLAHISH